MKIIFLDIDGVLNPLHYMNALYKMWKASFGQLKSKDDYGDLFFDQNCDALRKIIEATGAKIVISSTWRKEGMQHLLDMWKHRNLPGEIIGLTPTEQDLVNSGKFQFLDEVCRGDEIKFWIEAFNFNGNYIIIDDTKDMLKEQEPFFIKTNSYFGLSEKEADQAIKILNYEESAI
jgi:hypothetical protein